MNKYQLLYIINNGITEEEKGQIVDKFSDLVVSLGGEIFSIEKWGARKFAYPIANMEEGYYVLVKFVSGPEVPAEIDRQMKINDKIVRQMITRY